MTDEQKDGLRTDQVAVVIQTDRGTLALWRVAVGLAPGKLAWVQIGPATVLGDDEISVAVMVPEAHRAYLEAALGPEFVGSALEDDITTTANEIYEDFWLQDEFLALEARAETDLPVGSVIVPLSLRNVSDLSTMIAESQGDVGRIGLWRVGDASQGTARIGVHLAPALLARMEATFTAEERAGDPGGVVIMTVLEALREERGEGVAVAAGPDDGDIPF